MIRIGPLTVGIALAVYATAAWPGKCDERYPFLCQDEPAPSSEPEGATQDAIAPSPPPPQRKKERATGEERKSPEALSRLRQQFKQFLTEYARQHGVDAASNRSQGEEELFRQFERWRQERSPKSD